MKAIMISVKPKWVEKILNGEKTIEIRKTMPKCELPCKVYIYETKDKILIGEHFERSKSKENLCFGGKAKYITKKDYYFGKGKVVAEFTLNKVEEFNVGSLRSDDIEKLACLSHKEMIDYFYKSEELDGNHSKQGYAWHIDDLIIYNKPKELSEFDRPEIDLASEDCRYGVTCPMYKHKKIKRPPQSWCYVEEIGEEV
jgi:predicted transcriptional regulator